MVEDVNIGTAFKKAVNSRSTYILKGLKFKAKVSLIVGANVNVFVEELKKA
jgi:hypothetical protein